MSAPFEKQWANGKRKIRNEPSQERTWTIVPGARVLYVYFSGHVAETQGSPGDNWDQVFPVIHMRHEPCEPFIDEICKILVPDAGHPIAHHTHGHARLKVQAEEEAVEKGERRTKRVAHDRDGRCALRREGLFDSRKDVLRRAVCEVSCYCRVLTLRVCWPVTVTYLACCSAKPLWAWTEDGIPGKSDVSSGSRKKIASVTRASLESLVAVSNCHSKR